MCGITGAVPGIDPGILGRMTATLAHRGTDSRVAAQQARQQRPLAHLQAEKPHGLGLRGAHGDVFRNVQRQLRFAHALPRGQQNLFALLQAAGQAVERRVTLCQPGQPPAGGRRDYSLHLWALLVLEEWCRQYLDKSQT
jgi:hypothetical protein